MFIVTQDRKYAHNLDKFLTLETDGVYIIAKTDRFGGLLLGEYKTNERAIEVRDQMLCSTQTLYMPEE